MGKIVLLDDLTINKIAAGEVIERPASVIKEMVENSIDAGANNITVEIKNGGISFIKITDNGKGILPDDMEMAFERHATSKIRTANDLDLVKTMGFRGEALASIAAIANVEMVSKTEEQVVGNKIVVEAGNIIAKEEVACPTGTSITVTNLFFNTPVRYKFLKKDYTESGYIEDAVARIALINPDIAIKLINSGKTILQTTGNGDMKTVIYSIYGKDIATGIIPVDYNYEDIKVTGIIGKPEISRSNRSNQLFFVNKRYIKDKTMASATEQAYKGLVPLGKFGFVILNMDIDPSQFDVNVHPAKLEVRFEEESKIFRAIYHSIKDTLSKNEFLSQKNEVEEKIEKRETIFEIASKNNNLSNGESFSREEKITTEINSMQEKTKTSLNIGQGGPVNTSDILEQLRTMNASIAEEKGEEYKEKIDELEERLYNGNLEIVNTEEIHEENEEEQEDNEYKEEIKIEDSMTDEAVIKEENEEQKENIMEETETVSVDVEQIENNEEKIEINTEDFSEENTEKIEKNESEDFNFDMEKTTEFFIDKNEFEKKDYSKNELDKNNNEIEEQKKEIQEIEEDEVDFDEMYQKLFGRKPFISRVQEEKENLEKSIEKDGNYDKEEQVEEENDKVENISVFEGIESFEKPTYKYVGETFDKYIIIEMNKEMYILDKVLVKEKNIYEEVKNTFFKEKPVKSEMLLLPDIITLSNKQKECLQKNINMITNAGFSLEEFGESTIKLTGVPAICEILDDKALFLEILDELSSSSSLEKEEKFMHKMAQKVAEEKDMNMDEKISMIDKLLSFDNPFELTNGKKVAIEMTKNDIERKFSRK